MNKLLALLFFPLIACAQLRSPSDAALLSAAGLRSGLLGYWAFSENTGTTIADLSGNGYTATLTNSPPWTNGFMDNAVYFNSTNTRARLSDSVTNVMNLETSGVGTISAWIKWNEAGVSEKLSFFFGSALASTDRGFGFGVDNRQSAVLTNALRLIMFRGQSGDFVASITAQNAVTNNSWTHVAAVLNRTGGTNRFFVNGFPVATYSVNTNGATLSTGGSNRAVNLGRVNHSADFGNEILLDEVAIYNRALSAAEIHRLYNYGRGSRWPFTVSPPVYGN